MTIRFGELLIQTAGGKCAVCKQRINPGPAIQLSSITNQIRHENCTPKEDTRAITARQRNNFPSEFF